MLGVVETMKSSPWFGLVIHKYEAETFQNVIYNRLLLQCNDKYLKVVVTE